MSAPDLYCSFYIRYYPQPSFPYRRLEIEHKKFALFDQWIKTPEKVKIDLADHNIVIMQSIDSDQEITIIGDTVLIFADIRSSLNKANIIAKNYLVSFLECPQATAYTFKHWIQAPLPPATHSSILDKLNAGIQRPDGQLMMDALMDGHAAISKVHSEFPATLGNAYRFYDIPFEENLFFQGDEELESLEAIKADLLKLRDEASKRYEHKLQLLDEFNRKTVLLKNHHNPEQLMIQLFEEYGSKGLFD